MEERFWPIPIVKPEAEWNDFDRDYVEFMRTAFAEGYRPREEGACTCISVGDWSKGRSASLVNRGAASPDTPVGAILGTALASITNHYPTER